MLSWSPVTKPYPKSTPYQSARSWSRSQHVFPKWLTGKQTNKNKNKDKDKKVVKKSVKIPRKGFQNTITNKEEADGLNRKWKGSWSGRLEGMRTTVRGDRLNKSVAGFACISSSFQCIHFTEKADRKPPQGLLSSLFYLLSRLDPMWTFSLRKGCIFPSAQSFTFWIVFHTRSLSLFLPSRVSMASAISDCSCDTKIRIISMEFTRK